VWASGDAVGIAQGLKDHKISILDNCLPGDPGWDPTGGCTLKAKEGDVSFVEFGALLVSPLTQPPFQHLIGHSSWRNDPSYSSIEAHKAIDVKNEGGRVHSFTEVANYGGGFITPLNIGLTQAPECDPALGDGAAARRERANFRPRARPAQVPVLHPSVDARGGPRQLDANRPGD
jgi:hypothetical protein